jgi:protein-tyrosine phosphatase
MGLDQGLAANLPAAVQKDLGQDRRIALTLPGHPAPRQLIHSLGQPVVVAALPASTAQELADAVKDHAALIVDGGTLGGPGNTLVALEGKGVRVLREGSIPAQQVDDALACRVLFVCTGNTCRSPMAKALCEKMLADRLGSSVADLPRRGFVVQSAGLAAAPGNEASPEAVDTVRTWGADLVGHRSQSLTLALLGSADFVFAVTRSHLRVLQDVQGNVGPWPRLLSSAGEDIDDPIGGSPELYERCATQIRSCLEEVIVEIMEG